MRTSLGFWSSLVSTAKKIVLYGELFLVLGGCNTSDKKIPTASPATHTTRESIIQASQLTIPPCEAYAREKDIFGWSTAVEFLEGSFGSFQELLQKNDDKDFVTMNVQEWWHVRWPLWPIWSNGYFLITNDPIQTGGIMTTVTVKDNKKLVILRWKTFATYYERFAKKLQLDMHNAVDQKRALDYTLAFFRVVMHNELYHCYEKTPDEDNQLWSSLASSFPSKDINARQEELVRFGIVLGMYTANAGESSLKDLAYLDYYADLIRPYLSEKELKDMLSFMQQKYVHNNVIKMELLNNAEENIVFFEKFFGKIPLSARQDIRNRAWTDYCNHMEERTSKGSLQNL